MSCKNCGKEIEDNAKFCSNCGFNFESENQAEKVIVSKKRDKLNTAFVLNIIALGIDSNSFTSAVSLLTSELTTLLNKYPSLPIL